MEEIELERISDYNLAYMNRWVLRYLYLGVDSFVRRLPRYERRRLLRYGLIAYEWPRGYFLTEKGLRLLDQLELGEADK